MKRIRNYEQKFSGAVAQGKNILLLVVGLGLSGCSIWNSYLEPDYHSTRADRVCHPYGDCSQGEWVAVDGVNIDSGEARAQCLEEAEQRHGNGWWKDSVSSGLEVGRCMEKKGFALRQ